MIDWVFDAPSNRVVHKYEMHFIGYYFIAPYVCHLISIDI